MKTNLLLHAVVIFASHNIVCMNEVRSLNPGYGLQTSETLACYAKQYTQSIQRTYSPVLVASCMDEVKGLKLSEEIEILDLGFKKLGTMGLTIDTWQKESFLSEISRIRKDCRSLESREKAITIYLQRFSHKE